MTLRGFVADSAVTLPIGNVDPERLRLLETCQRSLFAAIEATRVGNHLSDIGHAVQTVVEDAGFSVVRALVGHGVGRNMHEDPQIPNYGPPGRGPELKEGMVFAIEPMITAGAWDIQVDDDGWSIYTTDGSMASHFEHTVAVTADGPRVLTRPAAGSVVDEPVAGRPRRSVAHGRARRPNASPHWSTDSARPAVARSTRPTPGYHRAVTDDGPLDRAAALERATAATALPTGVALTVAAVVASDHPARSLVVSAAVAITVATALHVAEGAIARPGRLRGLDGQPVASPRATMLRALPGRRRSVARAGAPVRARLARSWRAVGGARRPAARRGPRRARRAARAAALGAAPPRRRARRPRPRLAVDAPRRDARARRAARLTLRRALVAPDALRPGRGSATRPGRCAGARQ